MDDQGDTLTDVEYREQDGVAVITLAAPERRNALTPSMSRAVTAGVKKAESNPSIGALVITADGPTFSAGADRAVLSKVMGDPLRQESYEDLGAIYEMFLQIQASVVPTVAAVNGAIVGASVNLALACDVRIVSADLRVVGFGVASLHPGGGHLRLLARSLGPMAGAAIALFGKELDAKAAVATGFAIACVERERLEQEAVTFAAEAARDPQLTRQVTSTWRLASTEQLSPAAAVQLERAPQVWSLRRRRGD